MTPLTRDEQMRPKTPGGGSMRAEAAKFIKPNDRLTSFERLEIYNRQYWFRVLSGFAEDFPGLRAVLGERKFDAVAKAYLIDCPSESFTLRNLGSRLEAVAAEAHEDARVIERRWRWIWRGWSGRTSMRSMGWRRGVAAGKFGGGECGPKLRLRLQPYIHLLDLRYPVDELLIEVRKDAEELNVVEQRIQRAAEEKRVQQVAALKPAEIFLAVHRVDEEVYFRRLEREEYRDSRGVARWEDAGAALEAAWIGSKISPGNRQSHVQQWFQTWSSLGWFCHIEKNSKN